MVRDDDEGIGREVGTCLSLPIEAWHCPERHVGNCEMAIERRSVHVG